MGFWMHQNYQILNFLKNNQEMFGVSAVIIEYSEKKLISRNIFFLLWNRLIPKMYFALDFYYSFFNQWLF